MGTGLMSPVHLMFLAVLALLLFGAKRLPEVGRSLGSGLREFKTSVSGIDGLTGAAADELQPPLPAAEVDVTHAAREV